MKLTLANTQTRIKLALVMSCLLVVGAVYAFKLWTDRLDRKLAYQYNVERSTLMSSVFQYQKKSYEKAITALTHWDDLATFAQNRNMGWVENLNVTDSMELSGLWVFDADQSLIYRKVDSHKWPKKPASPPLSINPDAPKHVSIYYVLTPKGVQSIIAGRIYSQNRARSNGKHSGYLAVAKLIDKPLLASLSSSTDSIVQVTTSGNEKRDPYGGIGSYSMKLPLLGADKKPVAWLKFTTKSQHIAQLRERQSANLLYTSLCLLFLVLGFGLFLRQFVAVPKKELSEALKSGDSRALAKHIGSNEDMRDIVTLVEAHSKNHNLANINEALEKIVYRRTQELENSYGELLEALVAALELRDQETEGHSRRVTELTVILAQRIGFTPEELVHIRRGALLHDIGKIGIPDAILLKCGPLNPLEREIICKHPEFAQDILQNIEFIKPAMEIPLCHHEKWDGTGYPRGLKGEEIPLSARIFSIIDVWDALSSDRPYRKAWPQAQVRSELERMSGTHFDPRVVAMMLCLLDEGTAEGVRKAA